MRYFFLLLMTSSLFAGPNQTDTLSPILSEDDLPFVITIEEETLQLPAGIHSGAGANYKGKWVFIAGRTNGLHGFGAEAPFPPSKQNTTVYVVDWAAQQISSRDLTNASSGLTQNQIDQLSVTSPQSFLQDRTLYICGGYGVTTATGAFGTKSTLTAVDIPKLIKWVQTGEGSVAKAIRQTSNEWMRVTGGYMAAVNRHLEGLLIFGQNFAGVYTDASNGAYTQQVRRFQIIDSGKKLYVQARDSESPNPNYRRRDLNVVPTIKRGKQGFVALSGVFTLDTGIWTVPVVIDSNGATKMADPSLASTFKQGMNNYVSATAGVYSKSTKDMYVVQLGGISFGYFDGGSFTTDSGIPFINQVTTVKMDKRENFTQYLNAAEYPVILSTGSNPGNRLIFGAGACFMKNENLRCYPNGVGDLDKMKGPTVLGYVVGGIMSTLPNTSAMSDSTASPYIFRVILTPK